MQQKLNSLIFKNKRKTNIYITTELEFILENVTFYRICKISRRYYRWKFNLKKKNVNDISHKLIKGNGILSKIRNYVNKGTSRTACFDIFIDFIYTESCVFINNYFNKDSFAIFAQNYNFA